MCSSSSTGNRRGLHNVINAYTYCISPTRSAAVYVSLIRSSRPFAFEGIAPRVDQNDLCGEGMCRKKLQESIDRGFFYVFANKVS